jgi:hypothetical protein
MIFSSTKSVPGARALVDQISGVEYQYTNEAGRLTAAAALETAQRELIAGLLENGFLAASAQRDLSALRAAYAASEAAE